VDFLFALVQRYAVSPGLTGRGTDRVSLENRVAAGRAAGETEPQQQLTDQGAGT